MENGKEEGGRGEGKRERKARELCSRRTIRHQIEGTDATTSLTTHNRAVATVHSVKDGREVPIASWRVVLPVVVPAVCAGLCSSLVVGLQR